MIRKIWEFCTSLFQSHKSQANSMNLLITFLAPIAEDEIGRDLKGNCIKSWIFSFSFWNCGLFFDSNPMRGTRSCQNMLTYYFFEGRKKSEILESRAHFIMIELEPTQLGQAVFAFFLTSSLSGHSFAALWAMMMFSSCGYSNDYPYFVH